MNRFTRAITKLLLVCAVAVCTAGCSTTGYYAYPEGVTRSYGQPVSGEEREADDISCQQDSEKNIAVRQDGIVGEQAYDGTKDYDLSADATNETEVTTNANAAIRKERLSLIPHYGTRHYISQFEGDMLDNFAVLYEATLNHRDSCEFITYITKEEFDALTFALKFDCPELFCFDTIRTYYEDGESMRNIFKVNIGYVMDMDEYLSKYDEAKRTIDQIVSLAQEESCDSIAYVYDFLTENCSYNLNTDNCGNAYGAIVEKQTKCDGISLAYMWILEELGEDCFVMAGSKPGDKLGHGWNVVMRDGEYYATDLTADLLDVFLSGKTRNWYPSFNASTKWVENVYSINETPDYFPKVSSNDMSESFHVINDSYCSVNEDEYQRIFDIIDRADASADHTALIQFETDELYQYFKDQYGPIVEAWAIDTGYTSIEYTYSSIEEYRTVQLMVNAE